MAEQQVIRQDVVRINWDIDASELKNLIKWMNKFKEAGEESTEKTEKGFQKVVSTAKSLKTSLTPLNTKINNLGKAALNAGKRIATGLGRIAKKAVLGLTAAVAGATVGLMKCVNLASDLQETTGKVEVSFGGDSGSVKEWSKNSIKSMGLAQQSALDAAALFGDMGTSMGLSTKEAADMSMSLVQLGADMSSFKNIDTEQSMNALKSIFTGETETLKNLGIVMTQTNLEAYALSKGIKKPLNEMTESEKVMLRYQYVMEKTKNAQGDFERTGGNWANQMRMLKEQFKQLGASIGQLPMGKLTAGLRVVNEWMTKINEILADGWQDGDKEKLFAVFSEAGTTIKNKLVQLAPIVGQAIADLVLKAKDYLIANKGAIWEGFKDVMAHGISLISQLFTGEGIDIESIKTKIQEIADKMMDFVTGVKENWPAIKATITGVAIAIGVLKAAIFACNAVLAINNGIAKAKQAIDIAMAAKTKIATAAQWLFNTSIMGCPVFWIIAAIIALIAIIVLLAKNWDKVKAAAEKCWEGIKKAWSAATGWLDENVVEPIKSAFQGAWDFVTDLWGGITDFFSGLWDGIKNIVSKITGKASEAKGDADKVKATKHAKGGLITTPHLGIVGEAGPEMIIPLTDRKRGLALWAKAGQMLNTGSLSHAVSVPSNYTRSNYTPDTGAVRASGGYCENNTYAPSFTLNFTGTTDRNAERTVKRWIQESMEEMFDSMGRKNPRLTEV